MYRFTGANSPARKGRYLLHIVQRQQGIGLAETLVATAILSLAIVALLSAFSTGALALRKADVKITAQNLARNQMEFTKSQPYLVAPAAYSIIAPVPADYSLLAQAEPIVGRDEKIQKVTVTVERNGNPVYLLEGFKLDR
jgi:hypothetical protein